jgi:hypothetical protein
MKYALVNGVKSEAKKKLVGYCPSCGKEMTSKCGPDRVDHWAHKGIRDCDSWHEPETPWHREWKAHFHTDWQEITHNAEDGEIHRADVKTDTEWVLEFQHSFLNQEERQSRDDFYPKLVWVVDGMRRLKDKKRFNDAIKDARTVNSSPPIYKIDFPDEFRIINEWYNSPNLVFLDFKGKDEDYVYYHEFLSNKYLWFLIPTKDKDAAYLSFMPRDIFVQFHLEGTFDDIFLPHIEGFQNSINSRLNTSKSSSTKRIVYRFRRRGSYSPRL